MPAIGENIRKLRAEQGITQDQLAQHLNISFQAISKWENSVTQPDIDLLPDIAAFFGVTVDELLKPNMSAYVNREARLLSVYEHTRAQEDYERAHGAYERLIARGDATPHDVFGYAYIHRLHALDEANMAEAGFGDVITLLEEQRGVDYYHALKQLVYVQAMLGRADDSITHNRAALEREPDIRERYVVLAVALEYHGRYQLQRGVIEAGLARFPDDAELILCEGGLLYKEHRFEDAITRAERAFALDGDMAPCLHLKADCLIALGRIQEAADVWHDIASWLRARHLDVDARWAEGRARELEARTQTDESA